MANEEEAVEKQPTQAITAHKPPQQASLFELLRPYLWWIIGLALLTVGGNALNLTIPKILSSTIDSYAKGNFVLMNVVIEFALVALGILILTYLQAIVQTYTSERVARNLRTELAAKISLQDNAFIQRITPSKLLTNLTSDVNSVKTFVSQAIASLISSVFLIIGASILLLLIDWRLALAVLAVLPVVGVTFYLVLARVRKLFTRQQEAIDWLNKVINESILGSALIRLLNSQQPEYEKFLDANTEAKSIGFSILRLFASLIPVITFSTNLATLIILTLGGHFIINGSMTIGNFTAFNSYLAILIFPVIIIGFMSNVIAQAAASYGRIKQVLDTEHKPAVGKIVADLRGDVAVKNVSILFGERAALKDISFEARAGTKTAIIGPTAAGKTQLLYLLTGLIEPTSGVVEYDGKNIDDYDKVKLHEQVGFVFQDSILFNLSLRENIAFSNTVKDEDIKKAIDTAELGDFIDALPDKLNTIVSERGTSLSGGQKQRVMLARALALNPRVLLLDDFTARVDTSTEQKILGNVQRNYPDITLISVTQKIAPIEKYDQVILLMEGEILARGTHDELMHTSTEYVQIYDSQKSTNNYEQLHAE
jgi:ATP-binding cassette subfamily B protein